MKKPFKINIKQSVIDDLKKRLSNTRWTDEIENVKWDYGTNKAYLKELCDYWQHDFDWKKQETILNEWDHFKTDINGFSLHFIYVKSKNEKATPIVLLHGWPSSFVNLLKLIPLLTETFDVIIPSLPGFGFSDKPHKKGMNFYEMGKLIHSLMTKTLGYQKYAIRCSDAGHGVAKEMILTYPNSVIGMHTEGSGPVPASIPLKNTTKAEKTFIKAGQEFTMKEGGYFMLQSTKPQSLAYGLNDSPVGLAAWLVEKYRAWSDCSGDVETRFSKDDLLTTITLYWVTETINSSIRHYYELMHSPSPNGFAKIEIPTAILRLNGLDMVLPPKEWEERFYNVQRWTEFDKGGHFGEWEEPEAVAEDIKTFFSLI